MQFKVAIFNVLRMMPFYRATPSYSGICYLWLVSVRSVRPSGISRCSIKERRTIATGDEQSPLS